MRFIVLPPRSDPAKIPVDEPTAILVRDNWDDYTFKTTFGLYVAGIQDDPVEIGGVRIGFKGMQKRTKTELPEAFERLNSEFFSLGTLDTYYVKLALLGEGINDEVLTSLNDLAFDLKRFDEVEDEEVVTTSLLRDVSTRLVRSQFHRIAHGGPQRLGFQFSYFSDKTASGMPPLEFAVTPKSKPPTNIHVVIGRNGVGKTTLLKSLEEAVLNLPGRTFGEGYVESTAGDDDSPAFENLITVSFSAFDPFRPSDEGTYQNQIFFTYVGLKNAEAKKSEHKSLSELKHEFNSSVETCLKTRPRWLRKALRVLQYDPLIESSDIYGRVEELGGGLSVHVSDKELERAIREITDEFEALSSGHKIVLLTVAKLAAHVDERTLVLIDEPETHLHPPLLSAFIRATSELLADRNGVAIIATHSPVVLQEVPRDCVWKIGRWEDVFSADRPNIETFGENVGTLTREIFGLEVSKSGFYRMLQQSVDKHSTYEDLVAEYSNKLGAEAKAIVRVLFAEKSSGA